MTIIEFMLWVGYYYWPWFMGAAFVICMLSKAIYDDIDYRKSVKNANSKDM